MNSSYYCPHRLKGSEKPRSIPIIDHLHYLQPGFLKSVGLGPLIVENVEKTVDPVILA